MISRRQLLWGTVGVAALGGLGLWGLGRPALEAEIASMVRRRLAFLKLDPAGLQVFARDQATALLAKRFPTWNRLRYHLQSAVAPSFARFFRSNDQRTRSERAADLFVTTYLLSSDFFTRGSDESRVVQYVAFFDPVRACSNPFARSALAPATA